MTALRKPKKCKSCHLDFVPMSTLQKACSVQCAIMLARESLDKVERKVLIIRKWDLKTLSQVCREVQLDVNRYIVLRDRLNWETCISCGKRDITDAGHFYHAGSKYRTSRLRFDNRVIHGQCAHCNRYSGGGNHDGFRSGLIQRYGAYYLEELEDLKRAADQGQLAPLAKEEAIQIGVEARRRRRELEKECL